MLAQYHEGLGQVATANRPSHVSPRSKQEWQIDFMLPGLCTPADLKEGLLTT
jgi:hypothetical protein